MVSPKLKKNAALAAICCSLVGGFEGLRTVAYRDPVGIPTVCFGETKGVRLGQSFTVDECKGMLLDSLEIAYDAVENCTPVAMPDERKAALVSFAYNVGGANYCGSTLARKLKAGDVVGACNELPRWNRAKGIVLPGLTKRREAERELCLKGAV